MRSFHNYASKPRFSATKNHWFYTKEYHQYHSKVWTWEEKDSWNVFSGAAGDHKVSFHVLYNCPTSSYHMASLWKDDEFHRSLTISSFTFFERILPEVVFVVYSSFVPISEKKICFWSGATWVANGHWQVLNGGIPEAVICSNKPTGGQRQSSYSSPFLQ